MTTLGQTIATRSRIERLVVGESPVRSKLTRKQRVDLGRALAEAPFPVNPDELPMNRAEARAALPPVLRRARYGRWRRARQHWSRP